MLKKASFFIVFISAVPLSLFGQSTAILTSDYAEYQHGLSLYIQNQYSAAQRIFERGHQKTEKPDLKAETAYFDALSAIHLNQPDAKARIVDFVNHYPESPRRNTAYGEVARYYFENAEFKEAEDWYNRVDEQSLSYNEQQNYYFNRGYIAFKTEDREKAEAYFNRVANNSKYGSQAKYYLGFLAYEGDDYQKANELFEAVSEEEKTDKNVSYFQSDMSFKSGDFEKAIEQAKTQLPSSTRQEKSELNKIIGESYFNLKDYSSALPYLEKYEGKQGKWNNTDYYQLGYAYYKQNDYEKAISQFNKIIDGNDEVAQNAYYHLAESYIHLDQKQQALNAFKNASEMPYNETIKEDAALNYAKLSYDIGNNYQSVPEVLMQFIKAYPNSPAREEVQSLLINAYVTSKDYAKALELLENNKDFNNPEVYQKVAFYRGLELYDEGRFKDAKDLFGKAAQTPADPVYTARATYWKAESDYNLEQYGEALVGYKSFKNLSAATQTPEYKAIDYNLGYAYFNQEQYPNAATFFKAYLDQNPTDSRQKSDAHLRLGDSYFAGSDYWKAMEQYNQAIAQNTNSDYARFQKAISYGFVDRNPQKIEELNAFVSSTPNSVYYDDALYELGNTYINEGKDREALAAYDKIITSAPRSGYVSKAILRQGLIYYNSGQNQQALEKFKRVAADFPNTDEARQAVSSARNIYIDLGQTDAYASWVKTLNYINVSDADIDNTAYEAAETQLLDENEDRAITEFSNYLQKFPEGINALQSHFHLAQLYYKKGDLDKAMPHYTAVTDQPQNEFTETALERLARIYLEKNQPDRALPVLERLENEAGSDEHVSFAQSNLMKVYYEQENYAKTVDYAEKVLASDRAESRAKSDAQIYTARAAIQTGQEEKARAAYATVAQTAQGKQAAEAQYYEAYFKRKDGDFKASNEAVQILAKDFSGYKEYSVKGLLLMGKNFYDLNDAYQATYILQNIIDNFKDYPETVAQAKEELDRIKAEEAKTNSSVKEN